MSHLYVIIGRRDEADDRASEAKAVIELLASKISDEILMQSFIQQANGGRLPTVRLLTVLQAEKKSHEGLTAREREIAALIADGRSNRDIAEALTLSERTVSVHVSHILAKLGFRSRTQVARWAATNRLIS